MKKILKASCLNLQKATRDYIESKLVGIGLTVKLTDDDNTGDGRYIGGGRLAARLITEDY